MPPRYEVETWFERDRAQVTVTDMWGNTLAQWEDEEVSELIEDGFLDPTDYEMSAVKYLVHLGKIPEKNVYGYEAWKYYKDPDHDCSAKQAEMDRAKVKEWLQKALPDGVGTIERFSVNEPYGGGLTINVETSNGRVYSHMLDHSGDWKEKLNIHPDEEYWECLVYQDLATSLEYFDAELLDNTRAVKGYTYMRQVEEKEAQERYRKELQPLSWDEWLRQVDQLSLRHIGVPFSDLPDVTTYRDIYEDGVDPKTYFFEDLMPEIEADFGYAFTGDYD
jgi:hypothetical protein